MVLNVKRGGNGEIERFKSWVLAGGNHQTYDVDYLETYAPVVEFTIVRMFLYLSLCFSVFVAQVDN